VVTATGAGGLRLDARESNGPAIDDPMGLSLEPDARPSDPLPVSLTGVDAEQLDHAVPVEPGEGFQ
jgi:hypothetical protein